MAEVLQCTLMGRLGELEPHEALDALDAVIESGQRYAVSDNATQRTPVSKDQRRLT